MGEIVYRLRSTESSSVLGVIRIMLGVLFLMTGIMKLVVPMLWEAWSGQLIAADLPLYSLTLWIVPTVEILVGIALVVGMYARLAAVAVSGIMVVATYVHLTVNDPALFPLQPHLPIAPLMVLAMALIVVVKGAGALSFDRSTGSLRLGSQESRFHQAV